MRSCSRRAVEDGFAAELMRLRRTQDLIAARAATNVRVAFLRAECRGLLLSTRSGPTVSEHGFAAALVRVRCMEDYGSAVTFLFFLFE